jgi:hypothetical protein
VQIGEQKELENLIVLPTYKTINTNGIAELPEGVFYISSTLLLPIDSSPTAIYGMGKGTKQLFVV